MEQLLKPVGQRNFEAWAPPKPKLADGILTVLEIEETTLATEKFRDSMMRCFISVGLAPDENYEFVVYGEVKSGSMSALHHDLDKMEELHVCDRFSVGDAAVGLEMVKAPSNEEEREADDEGVGYQEEEGEGGEEE